MLKLATKEGVEIVIAETKQYVPKAVMEQFHHCSTIGGCGGILLKHFGQEWPNGTLTGKHGLKKWDPDVVDAVCLIIQRHKTIECKGKTIKYEPQLPMHPLP